VAEFDDGKEPLVGALAGFDWSRARDLAAEGTSLRPGDLLASPALMSVSLSSGALEIEAPAIGVLEQRLEVG
jgi:hypothetical protein